MGSIYGSTPKFNDLTVGLTTTASGTSGSGSDSNLTQVSVASGPTARNNMCIAVESLYLNITVYRTGGSYTDLTDAQAKAAMNDIPWKLAVVLDKQPNKAAIAATGIWESTDFESPLNLDNRKRVKILKTTKGIMHATNATAMAGATPGTNWNLVKGNEVAMRKIFLKFKTPIKVEFDPDSTGGAIGQITDNAISIWIYQEDFLATYAAITANVYSRIRFRDCT